ncbi:MAG TPA: uracil-DNA glycosylase [Gemmatimonadaceae bacterium]|nr:uracil-DNA glycosylase [Gemmatimonadaceae bacterium]
MDARAALRRYLEQRRELGESELVLDSLHIDEVMQLLGAATKSRGSTVKQPSLRQIASNAVGGETKDWRASLRDAGVNVDAPVAAAPVAPARATPTEQEVPPSTPAATNTEMAFKKGIVVGSDEAELIPGAIEKLDTLEEIAKKVQKCTRCPLYETATQGVPGEGDPKAKLVCVGEAPGAKEDETGRPFVGQAGQLLTKILGAIDLTREQVFICNVLKHRPPGNRNPRPEEVEACSPYLIRQLELIKPKVIVAFGTFAAQTLLNTKTPIGQLRGLVHKYHGIPLVVTYHPAALLRNPAWKRPTWEDVKLARRILDSRSRA